MRGSVGRLVVAVPLLVACSGGAARGAHSTDIARLGCSGWYSVNQNTLTGNLSFTGSVRRVSLSALLDNGAVRRSVRSEPVAQGTTAEAVQLRAINRAVTSVIAYISGPDSRNRSSCELSNPH